MARKMVWTRRAANKFNKIIDYLDREWGSDVTQSFVRKTYDIIELISDQPDLERSKTMKEEFVAFC
ncbi:MAG: type II toxin-antitoxin system RelE/ParE family toxin [Cyclobacteriaceae bacterium]|nr:type II toxin-antitoxin system RelE/ParE family toxin [Cyclobacteriaceae bacterium]